MPSNTLVKVAFVSCVVLQTNRADDMGIDSSFQRFPAGGTLEVLEHGNDVSLGFHVFTKSFLIPV